MIYGNTSLNSSDLKHGDVVADCVVTMDRPKMPWIVGVDVHFVSDDISSRAAYETRSINGEYHGKTKIEHFGKKVPYWSMQRGSKMHDLTLVGCEFLAQDVDIHKLTSSDRSFFTISPGSTIDCLVVDSKYRKPSTILGSVADTLHVKQGKVVLSRMVDFMGSHSSSRTMIKPGLYSSTDPFTVGQDLYATLGVVYDSPK